MKKNLQNVEKFVFVFAHEYRAGLVDKKSSHAPLELSQKNKDRLKAIYEKLNGKS